MAKLIKGVAWRKLERPYTRKSKYREKAYVRAVPANKIARYVMGNPKKKFTHTLFLRSRADIQLRHNSLEAARKTSNKVMETKAPGNYMLRLRVYPHHVLRNNPLAAGAGADRMSTGMAHSFGKTIGLAAQVHKGQAVFEVQVNKDKIDAGKLALERARKKMACGFYVTIESSN